MNNQLLQLITASHRGSPINSIGWYIQWLSSYNVYNYDRFTYGNNEVKYGDELICNFKIHDVIPIPIFYNFNRDYTWVEDLQKDFVDWLTTFKYDEKYQFLYSYKSDEIYHHVILLNVEYLHDSDMMYRYYLFDTLSISTMKLGNSIFNLDGKYMNGKLYEKTFTQHYWEDKTKKTYHYWFENELNKNKFSLSKNNLQTTIKLSN